MDEAFGKRKWSGREKIAQAIRAVKEKLYDLQK